MSPEVLVMSKKSFDKLSPEDQRAVRETAKESVAKMRELWEAREKEAEKKIRSSGSQINTVDKQPFIDAMKPVYEKYAKDAKVKDLVSRIQAMN
jgi:TRAP-type C4-dicarboxylate transport system substrate-binding protein